MPYKDKEVARQKARERWARNREQRCAQKREHWAQNKDEINASRRERRADDPEAAKLERERWRASYERHKVKRREYQSRYRRENREKVRAYQRAYREANEERERERSRVNVWRRLARKANAEGSHTAGDILDLLESQDGLCAYCECALDESYHVDHMTPLSRGGSDYPENLAITCPDCNLRKSNKTAEEYVEALSAA